MVEVDDAALVVAARADRQAFTAIYLRFADRLYRYALARSGSPALAEDVVSETMLAALEGLGRFDARRGTLGGWLFGIAHKRLADRARRQGRWLRAADRLRGQQGAEEAGADDVWDAAQRGEAAQVVTQLLATLNERDRQIVLLHYSAELNSVEIGEALQMRPGTVRQRLSRALHAMQQQLPPEPITTATPTRTRTSTPAPTPDARGVPPRRNAGGDAAGDPIDTDDARWRPDRGRATGQQQATDDVAQQEGEESR